MVRLLRLLTWMSDVPVSAVAPAGGLLFNPLWMTAERVPSGTCSLPTGLPLASTLMRVSPPSHQLLEVVVEELASEIV